MILPKAGTSQLLSSTLQKTGNFIKTFFIKLGLQLSLKLQYNYKNVNTSTLCKRCRLQLQYNFNANFNISLSPVYHLHQFKFITARNTTVRTIDCSCLTTRRKDCSDVLLKFCSLDVRLLLVKMLDLNTYNLLAQLSEQCCLIIVSIFNNLNKRVNTVTC